VQNFSLIIYRGLKIIEEENSVDSKKEKKKSKRSKVQTPQGENKNSSEAPSQSEESKISLSSNIHRVLQKIQKKKNIITTTTTITIIIILKRKTESILQHLVMIPKDRSNKLTRIHSN